MEEKKSKNSYQMLLLVLVLIVIMGLVGYNYLYSPMAKERDEIKKENYDLNVRLIELTNLSRSEEEFKTKINSSKELINAEMGRYSAGNKPEDSIMLVKQMIDDIGVKIPNISFSQPNVVASVHMPKINDTGEDSYTIEYYDVQLLKEQITMSYSCTYEQLKKMTDYINSYSERLNVDSITVSYDSESSELSGSFVMNIYTATGDGREYEAPEIRDIRLGEENIFSK